MDLTALRNPISPAAPSGVDLENGNDPRWGQLANLAAGEKRDGITQPPKWSDVRDLALQLAAETRHLRLGVILTECGTFLDGFPGLAEGLGLLRAWCESLWDSVYPTGDLADQRYFRPPVIEALNYPSFLVRLKNVPVSQSAGGRYSLADLEAAAQADRNDSEAANQARLVEGGFANTPAELLNKTLEAAKTALDHARAIEDIFDTRFGSSYGVNLSDLRDTLSKAIQRIGVFVAPKDGGGGAGGGGGGGAAGGGAEGVGGGGNPVTAPSAINSRESAVRALDKVIEWFEKNEPANPVPFLLKRAQRCATMDFFQLISELSIDPTQANIVLKPDQPSGY